MKSKFLALLGLGKRAGYLTTGETGCELNLKKMKSSLIVVAGDASENTKKKFGNMCSSRGVEMLIVSTKEELGQILGKGIVAVISVNDGEFGKALVQKLNDK